MQHLHRGVLVRNLRREVNLTCGTWSSSFQKAAISHKESLQLRHCPTLHVSKTLIPTKEGGALVVPFYSPNGSAETASAQFERMFPDSFNPEMKNLVIECIEDGSFTATAEEKYVIRAPKSENWHYKHVVLVGIGSGAEDNHHYMLGKQLRKISMDLKSSDISIPFFSKMKLSDMIWGVNDASYDDERYKGVEWRKKLQDGSPKKTALQNLTISNVSPNVYDKVCTAVRLNYSTFIGVNVAKDLVGAPPNVKTPAAISQFALDIAKSCDHLECKILGAKECENFNMGGYLAVQQGSKFPPQFIHMIYKNKHTPHKFAKKIAIVGKGLTFDSGGYNLKVGSGSMIEKMKFDMGGLATILGTAAAFAAFDKHTSSKLLMSDIEIHFISAVCENMISRDAMRPGDIVTASNGKTIEILNTDAEGRLTLADALVYAEKEVEADIVIDLATLTGASMIALGENIGSLFSSCQNLADDLLKASERSGDALWQMPLHAKYKKNIKSNIADVKNVGDGKAGSITAALFLQEFIQSSEWAHIDMAGPVWDNATNQPTGYGVRLLVEYILGKSKL